MATGKSTTDHDKIRRWVEKRGGKPACVRGTGGKGDTGLLRIDFPGYSGADSLQPIDWDEFFQKFDEQNLKFLYQDKTASGKPSNFNKLVSRDAKSSGARRKTAKKAAPRQAATARSGGKKTAKKKAAAGKAMTGAARKGTKKKVAKKSSSAGGRATAAKRKKTAKR